MIFHQIFSIILLFFVSVANAQMDDNFYQPSKEMKPFQFKNTVEYVQLPTDRDTITAYIAKPEGKPNHKTIIYFHGASGNVTTYQFMTKPLVEAGFQLVMVDVRGYGKSTGKPTHANVASDSQKMFDYVRNLPNIKNTKIYLYGASLGSQVASNLAKNNSSHISGLILDGPMQSFTEIAAHYAPQYKNEIRTMMVSPYSAIQDVALVNVPKLIITTKEDKTIPYIQQNAVYEAAIQPKIRFESSGDHLQGLVNNREELLKVIQSL